MIKRRKTFWQVVRETPWWQKGLAGFLSLAAVGYSFWLIDIQRRPSQGYDEEMWTGASISTYHMLFRGYVRPTVKLDNWFPTYAYKNGVDVFADKLGETRVAGRNYPYNRLAYFDPDTLRFPWDHIQWDTLGQPMSFAVKYDTVKFPRKRFQWFDNALWTFGWKAPNVGKAIMGFFIQTLSKEKPDPFGYFEYHDPEGNPTSVTFNYVPHQYLAIARIPNALFTAGTVVLVMVLGWRWLNFWCGWLAGLYLLLNTYFMQSSTAVGLDGSSIFFMVAALGCLQAAFQALDSPGWKKWLAWSCASGVLFGLGVGSKLNDALFAYIAIGLAILLGLVRLVRWHTYRTSLLRLLIAVFLTLGIGVGVFLIFNPIYRKQPLAMMRTTRQSVDGYFARRAKDQRTKFTPIRGKEYILGYAGPGENYPVTDTIRQGESISLAEGTKFGSWQVAVHKKKQSYVNTRLLRPFIEVVQGQKEAQYRLLAKRNLVVVEPDRFYATLGHLLPFPGNAADGILLLLGWAGLLMKGLRELWRTRQIGPYLLLPWSFMIIFIGTADFIWIDFSRYHIVLYPTMALCVAQGLIYLYERLAHWRRKAGQPNKGRPYRKNP
ncbi:MAG: phospholipid carrier-dependent glycosyltransferase [Flavobacteriales bacterium]|nr:phospholipid carrier-dependent glycosyltransferase [Flavobacteriales bacterium]